MVCYLRLFLTNVGVAAGDQMCGTVHKDGSYGRKEILNGPKRYVHALALDNAEVRRPDREPLPAKLQELVDWSSRRRGERAAERC